MFTEQQLRLPLACLIDERKIMSETDRTNEAAVEPDGLPVTWIVRNSFGVVVTQIEVGSDDPCYALSAYAERLDCSGAYLAEIGWTASRV